MSWFPKVDYIWMNGKLVPWDDARIHVLSHGAMYGTGVFEGIRCYDTIKGPAVFRLTPHMRRLQDSAQLLRISLPFSVDEIKEAILETIRANNLKKCYIRPLVSYGYHSLGVHPKDCPVNVIVAAFTWDNFMGEDAHEKGIRCCISSWFKIHSKMVPSAAKACGSYLNNMLAKIDATNKGFDEVLMLDNLGNVAEACTENIFIVRDGVVFTPGVETSILPGITRASIIIIARDAGYTVVEKEISVGEMLIADEIFLTGTAAELTPVREVDHRIIGNGEPGPITRDLRRIFSEIVQGNNECYEEWLDFVRSD